MLLVILLEKLQDGLYKVHDIETSSVNARFVLTAIIYDLVLTWNKKYEVYFVGLLGKGVCLR